MQINISQKYVICWLRRDLRLEDNTALYNALKSGFAVLPVFIFDSDILVHLPKADARVVFIHRIISDLQAQLSKIGSSLYVFHGRPIEFFQQCLANDSKPEAVYVNRDYEPYASSRDTGIMQLLSSQNIGFHAFKDHVIFEKNEVLTGLSKPYTVFTPYANNWKKKLNSTHLLNLDTEKYLSNLVKVAPYNVIELSQMGFEDMPELHFPDKKLLPTIIQQYGKTRDFPGLKQGTSRLGIHIRFGTISIRMLASYALQHSETWLNELIWRDFYQSILWHFPHVASHAFKPAYENIAWRNQTDEFAAWCEGRTGYPLVDAGIRELLATGYMHNRVRMVTASFLVKHLLIDWRWGESFFASHLLDFDLASNNGGWQWAAGSGCDAAPYFRVFNPTAQALKFDPNLEYILKWIPEYNTKNYPKPMVDHAFARQRALDTYKTGLVG